jgi:hypothetical protein
LVVGTPEICVEWENWEDSDLIALTVETCIEWEIREGGELVIGTIEMCCLHLQPIR